MTELERIGAQLDKAARHLNPMLTGQDVTRPLGWHAQRAHDALNALAAARLQLDMLQQTLEEGATS